MYQKKEWNETMSSNLTRDKYNSLPDAIGGVRMAMLKPEERAAYKSTGGCADGNCGAHRVIPAPAARVAPKGGRKATAIRTTPRQTLVYQPKTKKKS